MILYCLVTVALLMKSISSFDVCHDVNRAFFEVNHAVEDNPVFLFRSCRCLKDFISEFDFPLDVNGTFFEVNHAFENNPVFLFRFSCNSLVQEINKITIDFAVA